MIAISSLYKRFGSVIALDGLNFDIQTGELTGLLGPNGAGKSTCIKCIMGLLQPDSGSIIINGRSPFDFPREVKAEIGYVPEDPSLFPTLTAREYITMSGRLYHLDSNIIHSRITDLSNEMDFKEDLDKRISALSKGMKQKCVIIAALLHDPQVLILDEPFSGLDASSSAVLKEELRRRTAEGKTVVVSSHVMEVVERLCTQVHIINGGKALASGSVEEIVQRQKASDFEEAFISITETAGDGIPL